MPNDGIVAEDRVLALGNIVSEHRGDNEHGAANQENECRGSQTQELDDMGRQHFDHGSDLFVGKPKIQN